MVLLELILLNQAAELAVGYKKLGMDVCQEVVNKLGTLFFLWLSLPSLVCLCRRVPGCAGRNFWVLSRALFWGTDKEGLSLTPLCRAQVSCRRLPGLCIQATGSE